MLDEPTTGMDPMNRSHVWKALAELKLDRTLLLTTHSMEEADALGDRIGIMSHGQLVALGTALHLKRKFGEVSPPRSARSFCSTLCRVTLVLP
jgi:ABC-type multidrug transport system ATPase subunit